MLQNGNIQLDVPDSLTCQSLSSAHCGSASSRLEIWSICPVLGVHVLLLLMTCVVFKLLLTSYSVCLKHVCLNQGPDTSPQLSELPKYRFSLKYYYLLCMSKTTRTKAIWYGEGSLLVPALTILCGRTLLVVTKHPECEPGMALMDKTKTRLITFSEESLPIRRERCQNMKFSRGRRWKWLRLAVDDIRPSSENNPQAKTHKTQVWPKKTERSQCVRNLPSYGRRKVCTSHHNEYHLQHSSDWNNQ